MNMKDSQLHSIELFTIYTFLVYDKMKSTCLLLLVLVFTSCRDSRKDNITNLVNEWDGKEIVFPSSSVFRFKRKTL